MSWTFRDKITNFVTRLAATGDLTMLRKNRITIAGKKSLV